MGDYSHTGCLAHCCDCRPRYTRPSVTCGFGFSFYSFMDYMVCSGAPETNANRVGSITLPTNACGKRLPLLGWRWPPRVLAWWLMCTLKQLAADACYTPAYHAESTESRYYTCTYGNKAGSVFVPRKLQSFRWYCILPRNDSSTTVLITALVQPYLDCNP